MTYDEFDEIIKAKFNEATEKLRALNDFLEEEKRGLKDTLDSTNVSLAKVKDGNDKLSEEKKLL